MIFDEQISRKPNQYPWTKEFIDVMHQGFWTSNEFSFQSDIQEFKTKLTTQEQEIVIRTLSAIGQIEVAVKKFWAKLGDNLPHPSLTDLGYVMANVEVIHNEAYERLLSVLGLEEVFESNLKLDVIQGRVNYLRKYLHKYYKDSKKQYIYSLILFTLFIENVSLFSQFYIILWFNRFKNVLKDTGQQVDYTTKEETIHAQVGITIIQTIRNEYPELFDEELEELIYKEAKSALEAEEKIIDWILEDYKEEQVDASILKEFIKKRLNDSLKQIGFKSIFKVDKKIVEETTWFDEDIIGNSATDFFHKRPINYTKKDKAYTIEDLGF
jgi:ribonucleoside-diphosphate reductase beta chain